MSISFVNKPLTHFSSEKIFESIKKNPNARNEGLVKLYAEFDSDDIEVAASAEKTLEELLGRYTLHEVVLLTLPLWPLDFEAMEKIIFEQSESKCPRLRERAYIACDYLATYGHFSTAASIASKKLHHLDKEIKWEGFKYFLMLIAFYESNLNPEDLAIAIDVGIEMLVSDDKKWVCADLFFERLIKYGKKEDISKIKQPLLKACDPEKPKVLSKIFRVCESMVARLKDQDLISIPLEAAKIGCNCENSLYRDDAFTLFKNLLQRAPDQCMESVIQAILLESKKKAPCKQMVKRLEEFIKFDFIEVGYLFEQVVEKRWREYSDSLMEAIDNLSSCNDIEIKKNGVWFKEILERRLRT